MQKLGEHINDILEEANYKNNMYFTSLKGGSFEKDDFLETQIQFYYAVTFFSRPMSVIAAKIPDINQRLEIVRNVFEEHGEGDTSGFHETTFRALLSRFDISHQDIDARAMWPETRLFNTFLVGVSVMDHYLTGVAVFGIIERMFSDISYWIGKGIIDRKWLTASELNHYSTHEKLDMKHSQDFFDLLENAWNKDAASRYFISQGLWVGSHSFNNYYAGLFNSRQRRIKRDFTGPHTAIDVF